ncbi:MAG: hypothetical protein ACRDKJ_15450 [Actinomycetota bacterium]
MDTSGLKALLLLAAALPLAGLGNQSAGLAPGQKILDATDHLLAAVAPAPNLLAQEGPPGGSGEDPPVEPSKETRRLERALTDLATPADEETRDELRADFEDEADEIEEELDDLDNDLDERDAELDEVGDKNGVDGSPQLRRAEEKLRELEDAVRGLKGRLNDIRRRALRSDDPTSLIGEVRALGSAIAEIKQEERVALGALIEAAERRERGGPPDKDEKEEEEPEPSPSPTAEP